MSQINGKKFGLWSLRLDAIYCALLGIGIALWSDRIAEVIALPQFLIAATGIIVTLWAGLVLWMIVSLRIGTALRLVMGVNILASLLIAASAIAAGTLLAVVAVLAIAVDVAVFAVSQAISLRTLPNAQTA